MSPVMILGILLALSVAGNAYQYHQHTEDSIRFGTTKQLADDTKAAASACSSSVDNLAKAGQSRHADLLKRLAGIGPAVTKAQKESIAALQAKPDDPKDLCGSTLRYWQREIPLDRGKP